MKNKMPFLCAMCGALMGVCVLLSDVGFLTLFFGVLPLYAISKGQTLKQKWIFSLLFCLPFCAVGYSPAFCITTTLPPILNYLALSGVFLLITLLHGTVLSLSLFAAYSLPAFSGVRALYVAVFWAGAEWILGAGPFGWPTLRLALSLYKYPSLFQGARLGGILFVSGFIIGFCALLAEAVAAFKGKRRIILSFVAVVLFVSNLVLGAFSQTAPEGERKISLVQSGVTVIDWQRGDVYSQTLDIMKNAEDAELFVLPESILPTVFENHPVYKSEWEYALSGKNGDVLVGGRKDGHSAVFHLRGGEIIKISQKSREVPFFENGYGGREFYFLPREYDGIFDTDIGRVGTMLCYESLFSSVAREAVKRDADILAVLTNDSWFSHPIAKEIHLAHSVYRAAESGRAVLQSGLDGKTALIDNRGVIIAVVPHGQDAVLSEKVSAKAEDTLYNIIGDFWLIPAFFAVFVLALLKRGK